LLEGIPGASMFTCKVESDRIVVEYANTAEAAGTALTAAKTMVRGNDCPMLSCQRDAKSIPVRRQVKRGTYTTARLWTRALLAACATVTLSLEPPLAAQEPTPGTMAGSGIAVGETGMIEDEAAFLARCREETLRAQPSAASRVGNHCSVQWRKATAAAPMAEAILALALPEGSTTPSREEARARLPMVQWSSDGTDGIWHELSVHLPDTGSEISFYWQQQGSEAPYNVVDALRVRGVKIRTLGCPQYPGASMGREKVMHAAPVDGTPFTLTVYSRPAPIGIALGIYAVDVDFSDATPDLAALREGRYPGGGGRAFAVDPTGWVTDCPDPE
jgi:hypothetical protein